MYMFNPEIEQMPLKRLRQLQNERLQKLLSYVYERVPFYRRQWEEAGIRPADIKGVEDLPRLPFTHKDELRAHYPFGMFAVPMQEVARIHCSSGTTGKPTVVGYTRADLDIFAEVNARSLACAGARPGMKLHNAYGYGLFTGGLGLHAGAEKLGMAVVPVSGGMTERQLMLLQDFEPEVICCTPSYAQTLAGEVGRRGLNSRLKLQYAVLGAEPWTEAIRTQVEAGLGVQATNIYGLSEIMGPGVSQEPVEERGGGSHIWEDHFFPEVVHPETGEPLPEGETGVLVFTTLTKAAFPLIRYKTNDLCSIYYDPHARRSHIKMSPVRGRADDMLIIRGVNLFPTQVEALIPAFEELSPAYRLVVRRPQQLDELEVQVELAEAFWQSTGLSRMPAPEEADAEQLTALARRLARRIKEQIGLSARVRLCPPGEIPRSQGGKLSRVVDERKLG